MTINYSPRSLVSRINVKKKVFTVYPGESLAGIVRHPLTIAYDAPLDIDLREVPESILMVPFIVNVVPVLWLLGRQSTIPQMDFRLYSSLQKVREGYRTLYPEYGWEGEIVPEEVVFNENNTEKNRLSRVLFFSGGVDSTWSALNMDPHKTLLLSIRGHDIALGNDPAWLAVMEQVSNFAGDFGFQTGSVTANVFRLLHYGHLHRKYPPLKPWYGTVQHGPGLASLAFPLAFAVGMEGVFFSASGADRYGPPPWGAHPLLEPNLEVAGIPVVTVGDELAWPEKVAWLARFYSQRPEIARPFLRICLDEMSGNASGNCGRCEKCVRGIFSLMSQGENPNDWGLPADVPLGRSARERFEALPRPFWNHDSWAVMQNMFLKDGRKGEHTFSEFMDWFVSLPLEDFLAWAKVPLVRPDGRASEACG